ncbi:TonB-dependent receptor [Methylobacillus sp. Pita1]|uniref:TonB-dependent receptor n=1 Tax=Methylobacillus sp. Pita1 TaxID=3382642 RepID=UPI0038B51E72
MSLDRVAVAVGLVFAGSAVAAEDVSTLPEVNVAAPKEKTTSYKAERTSSSKFTAPLLDTPKSVTVISESVIKDTGSVSLEEVLRTVPGITLGTGEGGGAVGDRPFIRGFDAQASIYVDGVRSIGAQSREIFALESVEVIKGPSGAFDGRGSAGGSINLVTKQPKAENFIGGSVGLGTDKYRRVTVDGNYAVNEDIAVRLALLSHTADTPGRDDVDVKKFGIAPSITFGMNSPTSLNLSYYHLNTDDTPDYGIPYTLAGRSEANPSRPASVSKDNFYGYAHRDFRKTEIDSGTATLKHAFSDDVILKNVTRYDVSTNDYIVTVPDDSAGNVVNGRVFRSAKSRNATTRTVANVTDLSVAFDTWNVGHKLNTGVEYSHEETKNRPYSIVNNGAGRDCSTALGATTNCTSLYDPNPSDPYTGTVTDSPTQTTTRAITRAAYVFDSVKFNEQWLANVGVRYDDYSTDSYQFNRNTNAFANELKNGAHFWNYQAGLVYKPQSNMSVYASYGTSSTPTGLTLGTGNDNISAANQNLEPERSRSAELGVKWDVLEDLALTAAVFRTEKTNARVTLSDGTTDTAGDMKIKGVELGLAGKLTSNWQAFAGYTYLDSEVVDGGTNATGLAAKGNDFANTPKNSASLWTTYAILPKLTVGGGAFYVDKQFGNVANTVEIPSYTRFDFMSRYDIDKNLSLQLNVQNLTDKRYFNAAYSTHYAVVAPGRLAFLSLNFNY